MSEEVWYWREGSTQHGPIAWEKLQSLAECGKIAPNDWVTREGWIEWKLACEASEVNAEKAADPALDPDAAAEGEPTEPLPPLPPPVPLPIPVQAPMVVEAPMPVQVPVPAQVPEALPGLAVMTSAAEAAAPNGGGVEGAALPGLAPLAPAPDAGLAQGSAPQGTGMISGAAAPVNFASFVPDAMFSTAAPAGATVSLPLPLPVPITLLPPLEPGETLADPGPPPPSPDGVGAGDVQQLQRVLRDGGIREAPKQPWNYYAVGALAAAILGLLVLAFEMGLVAIGLGGYCLYAASVTGDHNGRKLALIALGIGALNVVFRVLCATMDLGLTHM